MSTEDIQKQISYFKACYQADNRTLSINNIFQTKIERRYFFEENEYLLTRKLNEVPIRDDYAIETLKTLEIYKREKNLYYCALFIVGKNPDNQSRSGKICAPILMYPAEIVIENEVHYLKMDRNKGVININFLSTLRKDESEDIYEVINNCVEDSFEDIGPVGELKRIFESRLDDVDAGDLLLFPNLYKESKIKKLLQPRSLEKQDGFKVIPGACMCIVRRSTNTRGIVSELQQLSQETAFSSSLEYLLDESIAPETPTLDDGKVPSLLSSAQKDAIACVSNYKGSLIIGPPGTGKSYTIAALAVSFLSQGKNVLIACKTDEAVDVVHRKIENDLGIKNVGMRAGRSDYKRQLKSTLSDLLSNSRKRPQDESKDLIELQKRLGELKNELKKSEKFFEKQVAKDIRWGSFLAEYGDKKTLVGSLKYRYIRWRVSMTNPHWQIASAYLNASLMHLELLRKHIISSFNHRVHKALYSSRVMFRDFHKSLSARNSQRQASLFRGIDLDKLLETFPIWLSNMSDIHDVLPMKAGLFDLVIIDEATQCDIASALPVLQRGKRFVIVGDPKQLRHASFISTSMSKGLARKFDVTDQHVDYRTTSVLDLVMNRIGKQEQVVFLNEHYRSKPKIISFSNKRFYNESLNIMTTLESIHADNSIELIRTNGVRDMKGHNAKEAELIIGRIKEIVEAEQNLNVDLSQTIGVLSPFRDQVEYIGELISKEIEISDIQKHEISCGTAYSFQGEERDIMLLSFAVDEKSHHAAIHHLNKEDVFNVSITRARSLQVIYTSFSNSFDPGKNLRLYLSHIQDNDASVHIDPGKDQFIGEVLTKLKSDGIECWINYSIGGLTIDILAKGVERKLFGINVIGYPGENIDALRMEDYKVLRRAGLPTFPLPYTYWLFDQDRCYEELTKFSEQ